MKRLICILLALCMVLCACTGAPAGTTAPDETTDPTLPAETTAPTETVPPETTAPAFREYTHRIEDPETMIYAGPAFLSGAVAMPPRVAFFMARPKQMVTAKASMLTPTASRNSSPKPIKNTSKPFLSGSEGDGNTEPAHASLVN